MVEMLLTCLIVVLVGQLGTVAERPPLLRPTPDRPLLMFQGPVAVGPPNATSTAMAAAQLTIAAFRTDVPPLLRPLTVIQVAARCCLGNRTQRMEVWRALLDPLADAGIPVVLQVRRERLCHSSCVLT